MITRSTRRRAIGAAAVLAVSALLASCSSSGSSGSSGSSDYVIGGIFSTSGSNAVQGVTMQNGAQLAVDLVNANGGINGHKVSLVLANPGSDTAKVAALATKLLSADHAIALVGPTNGVESAALNAVNTSTKIVDVAGAGTDPLASKNEYQFAAFPASGWLPATLKYLESIGRDRLCWLSSPGGDTDVFAQVIVPYLEQNGITMGTHIVADAAATDYNSELSKFKATCSGSKDAFFEEISAGALSIVGHNMVQLGMQNIPTLTHAGNATTAIASSLGADAEKFIHFPLATLLLPAAVPSSPGADIIQPFVDAYTKKYGEAPDATAAEGYAEATAVMNALKAGATSGSAMKTYLETNTVETPLYPYKWTAQTHNAPNIEEGWFTEGSWDSSTKTWVPAR